ETLPNGFVIAWQSADGPGDVGPMAGHNQDIYHRVYDNDGFFLCGSTKTNSGNDAAEEVLLFVHPLSSGDFAIMYKDQEEHPGNNKDDYFVRVTGGTPPPLVCPSLGTLVSSEFSICQTESSQFTISGLENMGASFNNSQNFGISFVAFNDPTINPYNGGEVLGVVPFNDLGSGGTTATLNASFNNPDPSLYIYALLSPAPDDGDCRPSSLATLSVNAFPIIDFPNLGTSCINAGIQAGLGQATPTGGTYSGPGVTNDGNGQTFTFDPTVAGLGIKLIMYSISANGCTSNFSSFIEVVDAPNVSFTAPDDLMINAGVQMGLGGGMPAQGSASGDQGSYAGPGVTDDGNGQSYSFDPSAAGLGVHTVTYTYTDANGCTAMASDEVEVLPAPLVISPIDDINDLDMDGNGVSVGQMVAVQGIVHCSDFAVNEAIWFWIMEANGDGIGVFANETVDNYVVMEGDELIIEGMVEQFQGLLEINPSKITVLSQNNDLLDPIPVNTLTEALESKWVRLDIPGVAPSEIQIEEIGNDILVNFPLDNQQTLTINALSATGITRPFLESFINASTDGTFQITGIVAQQDLQVPYDDFYQLFVCSEGSFDFVVGTEEPTWASEIQLFPNPTNAQLQIQAPVLIEALRLIDLQGRVIYEERVRDRQHQLDMRPFAAGLYQLQLISDGAVANRAVVRM
ncbi:MAG: T9SS type A sorting domain-containing protein, partial [Bacteroidota bacterium]